MITTPRLTLRPLISEDAPHVFEYRSDKEANEFQGWVPESLAEVKEFIQTKIATEPDQEGTWFQLAIVETETQKLVGDAGIHFQSRDQVELGCTLNTAFQGQGYATEAMKSIMGFVFEELQKHRIMTSIDPRNVASIKLVERLGMRKEAHFVQSYFFKGEWTDDVVYAMLQSEWKG